MEDGTLIHALLLDAGRGIVALPFDSFRSKAAQEARDEALAAGQVPVIAEKLDMHRKIASKLEARLRDDFGIQFTGKSEVVAIWDEPGKFGSVRCRAMMDHVFIDRGVILDLKKTENGSPRACAQSAVSYSYQIQHAAYVSALQTLRPDLVGRVQMSFLFVELEPPFAVTPAVLSAELTELGAMQWRRAITTWERCLRDDEWPGYTTSRAVLDCAPWAMTAELEHQEDGQEVTRPEEPALAEHEPGGYDDDAIF
jgi:hypothetical protein